jgi:serine/threonine protein kinase
MEMAKEEICPFCKRSLKSHDQLCPTCGSLVGKTMFKSRSIGPGDILSDRYRVVRELGRGGMGAVYLAEETTLATGRFVSIKILPAHLTMDKSILSRFQEEIRTAAGLDHPAIVPIYFVGEHKGLYYFVMKYLEGGTIHQNLKKNGPFSESETRRILAVIADALEYAHNRGVVHRDIKTSNIMVSPEGIPTLMDFGVSRSPEAKELTLPGQIVGTAEYMSPEQWYGEAEKRSDTYSMGVVMYFMLTGQLPFRSKNPFELMKMHQEKTPTPLSSIRSDISPEMESLCNWCMDKEKENRPSTSALLASCLRGEEQPPNELVVDAKRRSDPQATVDYQMDSEASAVSSAPENTKLAKLLHEADLAYAKGDLTMAIKLATKANNMNLDSTQIDNRLKKFTHLRKTVDQITKRAEHKRRSGFIHQAINDYQALQNVYQIPEVKKLLAQTMKQARELDNLYAEGKKHQREGEYKKALKCFKEVIKHDAENQDALKRKHEILQKPKRKRNTFKTVTKYKRLFIFGAIGLALVTLAIKMPGLTQKAADSMREKKMYASPAVFNVQTFYKILDVMEGPHPDRKEALMEMTEELVEKGNVALKKDDFTAAKSAYTEARKMMVDGTSDADAIDNLINKISAQIKFQ